MMAWIHGEENATITWRICGNTGKSV